MAAKLIRPHIMASDFQAKLILGAGALIVLAAIAIVVFLKPKKAAPPETTASSLQSERYAIFLSEERGYLAVAGEDLALAPTPTLFHINQDTGVITTADGKNIASAGGWATKERVRWKPVLVVGADAPMAYDPATMLIASTGSDTFVLVARQEGTGVTTTKPDNSAVRDQSRASWTAIPEAAL